MGNIIEGRQFVFDIVAAPVLFAVDTNDVIVSHHTGPHDVGTRPVVVRFFKDAWHILDHGLEDGFTENGRKFDIRGICRDSAQRHAT